MTRNEIAKIFQENHDKMIDLYFNQNKTCREIGSIFGLNKTTIDQHFRRAGIKIRKRYSLRKYNVDDFYFDSIDSDDKAWIMGWIASDGNIDEKRGSIRIGIDGKDEGVLHKIKKCIKFEGPIKTYLRVDKRIHSEYFGNNKERLYSVFAVANKRLCNNLINYGIGPRKSLTIEFPVLDEKYFHSFMRGYFEGDGCICSPVNKKNKKVSFHFQLIGTKEFLSRVIEFYARFGIRFGISRKKKLRERNINIYTINVSNKNHVIWILDKIYENHNGLFLDRKYQKYLEMKEYLKNNPTNQSYVRIKKNKAIFK